VEPVLDVQFAGIPSAADETAATTCRVRLHKAAEDLLRAIQWDVVDLRVRASTKPLPDPSDRAATAAGDDHEDMTTEARAARYRSREPLYNLDQLVVPEPVLADLLLAASVLLVKDKVFGEWGLSQIEPYPRSVLNFHGPSGTGKTMAAHALARHLRMPILAASYADIESKFLGSGPRNLEALFFAAERDAALLFVDEADSLLSARVSEAQSGSEKAVNSLRSQLLICLEKFTGVVVFASNFVESYDKAFKTRVRDVYFPLPDADCLFRLWGTHLPANLPLEGALDTSSLAVASEGLCGRDIKNAVIDAAVRVAAAGGNALSAHDFLSAIERLRESKTAGRPRFAGIDNEIIRRKVLAAADDTPPTSTNGHPGTINITASEGDKNHG
jgi:SpoVK/Ycf46/Vps4 family AAA+-type ATPase